MLPTPHFQACNLVLEKHSDTVKMNQSLWQVVYGTGALMSSLWAPQTCAAFPYMKVQPPRQEAFTVSWHDETWDEAVSLDVTSMSTPGTEGDACCLGTHALSCQGKPPQTQPGLAWSHWPQRATRPHVLLRAQLHDAVASSPCQDFFSSLLEGFFNFQQSLWLTFMRRSG